MKKTILVSDLTGAEITDHVLVVMTYGNTRETLDANRSELEQKDVLGKGEIKKRPGRPPKQLAAVA